MCMIHTSSWYISVRLSPSPSNMEMGSILQCPLLPKGRRLRPTCALHTDCWCEYNNMQAQQTKGIYPSAVPVLASIQNHGELHPINRTKISARVQDEGTALVLQAPVTQATCPCQELIAFVFANTNAYERNIVTDNHGTKISVRVQNAMRAQCLRYRRPRHERRALVGYLLCSSSHAPIGAYECNITTNGRAMAKFFLS